MFGSDENGLKNEKEQSAYGEELYKNGRIRIKNRWGIQTFLRLFCAVVLSGALLLGFSFSGGGSALAQIKGERTFYLDSASSQARQKEKITLAELSRVRGESVRFSIDEGAGETLVEELLKEYGGKIVLVEEACGVRSYYCYTPRISRRVFVEGKPVNLHIALAKTQAAVGSPIIFGGF